MLQVLEARAPAALVVVENPRPLLILFRRTYLLSVALVMLQSDTGRLRWVL